MSNFPWWMIFTGGVLVGFFVLGPLWYVAAKVQIAAKRALRAWHELKGWAAAGATAIMILVVVVLIGARSAGVFG